MKLDIKVTLTKEEIIQALTDYIERQTRYDYLSPLRNKKVVDWTRENVDGACLVLEDMLLSEEPAPAESTVEKPEAKPELNPLYQGEKHDQIL